MFAANPTISNTRFTMIKNAAIQLISSHLEVNLHYHVDCPTVTSHLIGKMASQKAYQDQKHLRTAIKSIYVIFESYDFYQTGERMTKESLQELKVSLHCAIHPFASPELTQAISDLCDDREPIVSVDGKLDRITLAKIRADRAEHRAITDAIYDIVPTTEYKYLDISTEAQLQDLKEKILIKIRAAECFQSNKRSLSQWYHFYISDLLSERKFYTTRDKIVGKLSKR